MNGSSGKLMSLPSRPITTASASTRNTQPHGPATEVLVDLQRCRARACWTSSRCPRRRAYPRPGAARADHEHLLADQHGGPRDEFTVPVDAHEDAVERALVADHELVRVARLAVEEVCVDRRQERIVGERDRAVAASGEVLLTGQRERDAVLAVAADQRQLRARGLDGAAEEQRAAADLARARRRGAHGAGAGYARAAAGARPDAGLDVEPWLDRHPVAAAPQNFVPAITNVPHLGQS